MLFWLVHLNLYISRASVLRYALLDYTLCAHDFKPPSSLMLQHTKYLDKFVPVRQGLLEIVFFRSWSNLTSFAQSGVNCRKHLLIIFLERWPFWMDDGADRLIYERIKPRIIIPVMLSLIYLRGLWMWLWFMVFNDTFNNISVVSCRSFLLVKETRRKPPTYRKSLTHIIA